MADRILIDRPVDMHAHLRQGEMLGRVAKLTATTWAGVLAMPNTDPIISTPEMAEAYASEIVEASGAPDRGFEVYPTLYFQPDYSASVLRAAKGRVISVKFYPQGLTTNSQHGCDPSDPRVPNVLASMEELGIPLCIHPEAPGYHEDREYLFGEFARAWATRFPSLKIVLEHISDRRSIDLLEFPNVFATVTPQHLLCTGDDLMGPPLDPHAYCMPVLKRPEDRDALMAACVGPHAKKIMAGTDSAPHTEHRKLHCGCAGCFTAPIAIQLYAEAFDRAQRLDLLPAFLGENARKIYGIDPPKKQVTLARKPFKIPESYGDLIPFHAGREIGWSVSEG